MIKIMPVNLYRRSVEIILKNQHASGSYIASPNFPTYQYAWFRDGAFCAYSMNLAGEQQSARRFHEWAGKVIVARQERVARAVSKAESGRDLLEDDILHTRFTLEGAETPLKEQEGQWPNFQLDGFGAWLWSLEQHQQYSHRTLSVGLRKAVRLTAIYLDALWRRPCYDCWEEFPDQVHPHTLAAIYAGLGAAARLLEDERLAASQKSIADWVQSRCVVDGRFAKFAGSQQVDASLLGLATPYRVVAPGNPLFTATLRSIDNDLARGGGVHRYATDSYYGGGEWTLLAAWLGWAYVEVGNFSRALELLAWVVAQAEENGSLPEQTPSSLIHPSYYESWQQRWGPVAQPLLWSHAQYIILYKALNR
ncbi:MAG: glycoside hydrolase family 15 protein [Chloroflexi bacterium]|nr:glycoside hydrolase family 15 protein [Chloroflexota bacterium]